jgi:hypothetical protein
MKEGRRLGGVHAGPESRVLEGVSWEEARQMQDAAPSSLGKNENHHYEVKSFFTSIYGLTSILRNRNRN